MTETTTTPAGPAARLLALGLLVAATAHVPGTGHHLAEAPYMGVAFVGFTFACLGLVVALTSSVSRLVVAASALLCSAGIATYALTRAVALPGLAHDVGDWLDPAGIVALAAEAVVVAASFSLLSSRGAPRAATA